MGCPDISIQINNLSTGEIEAMLAEVNLTVDYALILSCT